MTSDQVQKNADQGSQPHRNISRVGVYGVARRDSEILLIVQAKGPYAKLFDFPGGGIEFGETIDQALHREFLEEVAMDFDSMKPIANLTTRLEVPVKDGLPSYTFHHIGLIYSVDGLRLTETEQQGELEYGWVDTHSIRKETVSPFVWAVIQGESYE